MPNPQGRQKTPPSTIPLPTKRHSDITETTERLEQGTSIMSAVTSNGTPMNLTTPTEEEQHLQDLESLALRLRALEKLLVPPPAPKPLATTNETEGPTEDTTEDAANPPRLQPAQVTHTSGKHGHQHRHRQPDVVAGPLSRRIQKVETALWGATKERKIDEFLHKYESSKLMNNPHGSHPDRELLSLQAKSELILAAQDDLHKLAEESKEIQSLQRCAEIGGLKNVEPHYPALSKLETIHIEQYQQSNAVSDRMNKLTDDYNGLINTLSEVFLSWDALLTAAELRVSEVERSRG
ncbi:Dynactin subunit 3 [Mortierella sp. NVP85]|nr:Dynactin subunit 3 [Mortierella sp. NVP85]